MNTAMHYRYRGMGQAGNVITSSVGGTILASAPLVAMANPLAGAVVALAGAATELLGAIGVGKGCGQTCITATAYANQAETLLRQNIAAYFAIPAPRPVSIQQTAMQTFQQIWNGLVTACAGVPGTAGQNCVSDRQDGACKWKALAPQYPGEPAAGQCWNWWNAYYYPIADDTNVYNDAATAGPITGAVAALTGGAINPDLLIGLALLGGALMLQFL